MGRSWLLQSRGPRLAAAAPAGRKGLGCMGSRAPCATCPRWNVPRKGLDSDQQAIGRRVATAVAVATCRHGEDRSVFGIHALRRSHWFLGSGVTNHAGLCSRLFRSFAGAEVHSHQEDCQRSHDDRPKIGETYSSGGPFFREVRREGDPQHNQAADRDGRGRGEVVGSSLQCREQKQPKHRPGQDRFEPPPGLQDSLLRIVCNPTAVAVPRTPSRSVEQCRTRMDSRSPAWGLR